jgi:hypothetical protein
MELDQDGVSRPSDRAKANTTIQGGQRGTRICYACLAT